MADARQDDSYEGPLTSGVPGAALRSLSARALLPSLGVATAIDVRMSPDAVTVQASVPAKGNRLDTLHMGGRCEAGQDLLLRLLRVLRRLHAAGLVHGAINAASVVVDVHNTSADVGNRGCKRGRDEIGGVASVALTGLEFTAETHSAGEAPPAPHAWLAPEQELGAPASTATDTWQAAMTLLCSLSDTVPWQPPAGADRKLASTMLFGTLPEPVARKMGLHGAWKSATRAGASASSLAHEVLFHSLEHPEAKLLCSVLEGMLNPCPESRISVDAALAHAGLAKARRNLRLTRATG